MAKIDRPTFTTQHRGQSIDLQKLRQDQPARTQLEQGGMTVQQLERADRNGDGKIDADEAFNVADDFDRDGSRHSLVATDRAGQPTQAGKAVNALGLLMQNRELQGGAPQPQRTSNRDDILFVGMNNPTRESAGAPHEIAQLRGRGNSVTAVTDSRLGQDQIAVGGRSYDLKTPEGRAGFVGTLGLPADQAGRVADAIGNGGEGARDELAGIAKVWARAERGGTIPGRLVISGHNVGDGPWGDGNGQLTWDSLKGLADAMPRAAAAVEDLNISACYSGGEANNEKYREIFPNVRTIWAYGGSAPGSGSGATAHQAAWDRVTRGSGSNVAGAVDRLTALGTRKAENIATWTEGDANQSSQSLSELRDAVSYGAYNFRSYFSGERVVENSQTGPLREYYNNVQALLQRSAVTGEQRRELESRRDQTIRTLFYTSNIAPRFQREYGSQIAAGYQALGLTPPDFGTMSRQQAVGAIENFRLHLDQSGSADPAAQRTLQLLNGLWNLDPRTIPNNWI
ncbi:MAG: hypothetical protein JXR83_09930 [Deltaproteobacteria bacterium]|nr:hypothetical protein [Deltaproteobacteria bacterium]